MSIIYALVWALIAIAFFVGLNDLTNGVIFDRPRRSSVQIINGATLMLLGVTAGCFWFCVGLVFNV